MNVYKQLDLLLFLMLIIQSTFSIIGTRLSNKEIPKELKIDIFQRLQQKAGSQMKRLRFAQQKYLTSTKKQFKLHMKMNNGQRRLLEITLLPQKEKLTLYRMLLKRHVPFLSNPTGQDV